jgi:molybdopterin synthase catalytic subunit
MNNGRPSFETWLDEIKRDSKAPAIGIFFIHNGVVRGTTPDGSAVCSLDLSYDPERLDEVITQVEAMPGVAAARAWINEGNLQVGEDMICALVAGDVRKNVLSGWQTLVRRIKLEVITQHEILASPGPA